VKGPDKSDPFLEERVVKYDQWLNSGKIDFSSKVIPINESIEAEQWVLPTEQALEILRKARTVALTNCACRTHYRRCDKPVEVCLTLNETGEKEIAQGLARPITLSEAAKVLRKANENGLVHLTLYMPDHEVFALCNCCACCCHDLQILKQYGRRDLTVRSEYLAVTDEEACIHCGQCVARCVFEARKHENDQMIFDPDACFGCGLCVTTCSANAIKMKPRIA
jgi:ferredoxin